MSKFFNDHENYVPGESTDIHVSDDGYVCMDCNEPNHLLSPGAALNLARRLINAADYAEESMR